MGNRTRAFGITVKLFIDSWPQFSPHQAATRPLYVHTQPWLPSDPSSSVGSRSQMLIPIYDSMTPESRQVMFEKVTKVVAEHRDGK